MDMINTSLEFHKLLIITLFKQGNSEEEIAKELCKSGVNTSFAEILQYLEAWHVIPCPSPVYSKDENDPIEQPGRDRRAKLGVTCHHGETSHISSTNLAHIPSGQTPIENYQQDTQKHEEFACRFRRRPHVEPVTESTLLALDSDSENDNLADEELSSWLKQCPNGMRDGGLSAWFKRRQQARHERARIDGSLKRLVRKPVVRDRSRVQK